MTYTDVKVFKLLLKENFTTIIDVKITREIRNIYKAWLPNFWITSVSSYDFIRWDEKADPDNEPYWLKLRN